MAKKHISKRVVFPRGEQRRYLFNYKNKTGSSWSSIAETLEISDRTLTDWKREKFNISLKALKTLTAKRNETLPANLKIVEPYWYALKGAKKGGISVYKKYGQVGGDPKYRKIKWREWWKKEGRKIPNPIFNCVPISKPAKSLALAEFVGILIGDGGISKNQVVITQHHINDKEYCDFIVKLIYKLFKIKPAIYNRPSCSVNNITASRVELVRFLVSLGLPIGNKIKQHIDIPRWIKTNNDYIIACIRGLIDTDGCVFCHSYTVKNKIYHYKKISFSSRSRPLISSVYHFLNKLRLSPRITKSNFEIRIEDQKNIKKYFYLIGSHNPKHLNRYLK